MKPTRPVRDKVINSPLKCVGFLTGNQADVGKNFSDRQSASFKGDLIMSRASQRSGLRWPF